MQWTIPQINVSDEELVERLRSLLAALSYQPEQVNNLLLLTAALAFRPTHTDCVDLGEKLCAAMYKETSHHWQEMMGYISRLTQKS